MGLVYNILQMRVLNTNVMWFINHEDLLYITKYLWDTHLLNVVSSILQLYYYTFNPFASKAKMCSRKCNLSGTRKQFSKII